jgi:hypothetical protein
MVIIIFSSFPIHASLTVEIDPRCSSDSVKDGPIELAEGSLLFTLFDLEIERPAPDEYGPEDRASLL